MDNIEAIAGKYAHVAGDVRPNVEVTAAFLDNIAALVEAANDWVAEYESLEPSLDMLLIHVERIRAAHAALEKDR